MIYERKQTSLSKDEFGDHKPNLDDEWQQHYNNHAELHFGKKEGDIMSNEEDEASSAYADRMMRERD